MQECPAFCFFIAFAAKCRKGNPRFEDGLSSVGRNASIPTLQLCPGRVAGRKLLARLKQAHALWCEFLQASQFPLGSPTFSQSPFEVVHGRVLAYLEWKRFSSTLDAGKEADVDALTLCQLIVHHHECFHLVGQRKL